MNNDNISRISVIDPIGEAIDRVKEVLFNPFDLGKWFIIGFCAWLAMLGHGGGGGGGGFNYPGDTANAPAELKAIVLEHLPLIITIAIPVLIIVIAIGIVCLWLSSRGKFMFLHCVAENKAEVKLPWHKFRNQGNSLFLFRLIVGIIAFVSITLFLGVTAVPIVLLVRGSSYAAPALIAGIVLLTLIAISLGIVFAIILKFTEDFVVPIMYLRGYQCVDAWNEFRSLLAGNKGKFTLYILFQIVIAIAIGIIILALVCVTCCCAGCIMMIPYIGTVLLLPVFVFTRSYSLYYLAQYGRGYNVFVPAESDPQSTLPPEPEQ